MASMKTKVVGGGSAAALLLAVPFIAGWEGKSNDPYKDIVGVTTVCYGETRVPMRRYTDEECKAMLKEAVKGFMEPVLDLTPTLADRPYELAAATSLAYNIGLQNYKISTVRKKFLSMDFKGACNGFGAWNKARRGGRLVVVKGLDNRRKDETKLCLKGSLINSGTTSSAVS